MGMMLKNLIHPYIQSTTVLCDMLQSISGVKELACAVVTNYVSLLRKDADNKLLYMLQRFFHLDYYGTLFMMPIRDADGDRILQIYSFSHLKIF